MEGIMKDLERYKRIDKEIDMMCKELSKWRGVSKDINRPETLKKISIIEKRIDGKIDMLYKLKGQIETKIEGIKDNAQKMVLFYIYILGYSVEKTAEEMNYCVQHTFRIKKLAIEALEGVS